MLEIKSETLKDLKWVHCLEVKLVLRKDSYLVDESDFHSDVKMGCELEKFEVVHWESMKEILMVVTLESPMESLME